MLRVIRRLRNFDSTEFETTGFDQLVEERLEALHRVDRLFPVPKASKKASADDRERVLRASFVYIPSSTTADDDEEGHEEEGALDTLDIQPHLHFIHEEDADASMGA